MVLTSVLAATSPAGQSRPKMFSLSGIISELPVCILVNHYTKLNRMKSAKKIMMMQTTKSAAGAKRLVAEAFARLKLRLSTEAPIKKNSLPNSNQTGSVLVCLWVRACLRECTCSCARACARVPVYPRVHLCMCACMSACACVCTCV